MDDTYSLENLRNFLDIHGGIEFNYDKYKIDFDIFPNDFLKYAEYDLNSKYEHNLINALTNVKRAIDSQMDILLIKCGLGKRIRDLSFPDKIALLNELGVISPRILVKINKKRNFLEHQYKHPKQEDVEDALDVAILFIKYTEKFSDHEIPSEWIIHEPFDDEETEELKEYSNSPMDGLLIKFDYKNGKISIYKKLKLEKEIDNKNPEYLKYIRLLLENIVQMS